MKSNFNSQIGTDQEINELLNILSQTFSSTTTSQIKEAEEKLKQFDQVIINKISTIFELFTSDNIPLLNKKSLATRVKYIFNTYGKAQSLDLITLQRYIELLINNFLEIKNLKNIHISIIDQISEALKLLINNKLLKNHPDLLVNLSQSILSKINSSNSYVIFSFLYLIILSPNTNIKNINGIINDKFISSIKDCITNKNDINQTIKLLDLLSLSLKKMLYLDQAKYIITNIINNLYDILFRILVDYCMDGNSFVSFINKHLIDDEEHLKQKSKENLLKSKIFLVIGFITECDLSINNDNKLQNAKLIQGLMQILKILLCSFDYIIKEQLSNLELHYKEGNYEILIYQAFSLFNKCISVSPFKEEFSSAAKNFIFFKIFPFFTLDLGDSELFKESPDEYYLQVIDTMTEFNFKKIKTICGKTLTLICQNYPDLSFNVLNTIFELLIFFMEEYDRRNLDKYTLINNEIGEFFIDNYRNESIINISLLCMSILAKQAMINSDLKKSLHKFLLDNQMRLEGVDSEKIKFKLCLLYGLFLDALFDINIKEDKEFIRKAINFLISIILYSNKIKEKNGLSYQAFHSLEQILENDDFCEMTNDLVKVYFQHILESIKNSKLIIFFDMINIFIEKIPSIKENIVTITNYILIKIKNDLNEIKSGIDNDSSIIDKEMDIVGKIVKNFNNNELETAVCEFIIDFIKNEGSNDFIEKIMHIIVNYSKKKNKSNLTKQMLNDCDQIIYGYYNVSHYIDFPTFQLLNYLISNNPKEKAKNILLIKNIVFDSLQKIEDNFYGQENIIYTLSLIICWLISKENENINNNIKEEIVKITSNIISLVLNKLLKLYEKDKIINNDNIFLKYFYLVIIFSSFIYYTKYTFSIIYDKNYFLSIIKYTNDIMIENNVLFSLEFNKLLILGLSQILYENEILKMIIVYFKDAFILNHNLISKQLAEEAKILKNKNVKELNKENNEEENINTNYDYLVKKISDIIIKELILPKIDFDEYDIFNKLYNKLIAINETKNIINSIFGEMDEAAKKNFENILLTKKINISKYNNDDMSDEQKEEVVHRRIVKIKKNSM